MRVIAGEFKGRRLAAVKGRETRPTLDRVRESLFSILSPLLPEARVLDLFCGSGALAFEALSRGAVSAVLIDISRGARMAVKKNVAALDIADRVEFYGGDVRRMVRKLAQGPLPPQFDLVLADPPYFGGFGPKILDVLRECGLLAAEGMVIIEHHKKETPEQDVTGWTVVRRHRVGDTVLTFFRLSAEPESTTFDQAGAEE